MTIDEAIQHCKDEATKLRKGSAKRLQIGLIHAANDCEECAAEHEQLALWLTELKTRRIAAIKELERVKLPKTNADRIRQMTDEELAHEINGIDRRICDKVENCENDLNCYACRLKWLKQEVIEDATD